MPATTWTDAQILAQLNSGLKWTTPTITYRFSTSSAGLTATSGETSTFTAFNAAQQAKAIVALGLWDDLITQSIVQTTATNTASNIEFGNSTTGVSYAQAYFPVDGTVWFNTTYADLQTPVIGKHGFMTTIHELGHALGLNHMGNYDGAAVAAPSSYQDSTVLSIMSYFGPNWGSGAANGEGLVAWADWVGADGVLYSPQTPMLNDIMAIQAMYGADLTTRTGNTSYGFNSTVGAASGGIFDFTLNLHAILCIYDAGGIDTLDLSGWSTSSSINLVPGTLSSGNSMTNNISISYSTIIENAVGGAGDDTLVGNAYNNTLNGGSGADTFTGGMGNDTVIGGAGTDTAIYSGAFASTTVSYNATTQTFTVSNAADGTDTVTGVENFIFNGIAKTAASMIPSTINASISATIVSVNEGNSGTTSFTFTVTLASAATSAQSATYTIAGNGVNAANAADFSSALTGTVSFAIGDLTKTITVLVAGDTVFEQNETFAVTLSGATAGLTLTTATATATIVNDDINVINGTAGDDNMVGTTASDQILGLAGNDTLVGNGGVDFLNGGAGFDTVNYASRASGVNVDLGAYSAGSGNSWDGTSMNILTSIENVVGSSFGDLLTGDANDNTFQGIGGLDYINGGAGLDTVSYVANSVGVKVNLGAYGTGSGNSWDGTSMNILTSIENIVGSSIGDTLTGDANDNTFQGNGGLDYINGGAGLDTVSYVANFVGVKVNLGAYGTGSGNSWDGTSMNILSNIENVLGSSFGDILTGDSNNNTFNGGLGNDTLMGGMGADTFRFTDLNFGADTVADYNHGEDYLSFSAAAADSFTDFVITNNDTINVLITLTSGGTISLHNGSVIHLDAADFLFV